MRRLRAVLLALALTTWVGNISPSMAQAAEAFETHDCQVMIIKVPCSWPQGEWFWICQTYHGGIEVWNACELPPRSI